MDRLGYDVIKVESGIGGLPAADLRRRAHAAGRGCSSGWPAAAGRPGCTSGSARSATGPGRPSTSTTRCCRTSPGSTCRRGTRAGRPANDPIPGINRPIGFHDPDLTDHNHLRHLLQVGYVDRQLGLIMRRMRRTELFDRALLVVVADHGYSFELDVPGRRQVRETNIDEIAARARSSSRRPARPRAGWTTASSATSTSSRRSPTCSASRSGGRHDGYSVFSETTRGARPGGDVAARLQPRDLDRPRRAGRACASAGGAWRAAKFGTGAKSAAEFGDPWASAYRIGPHQELLGRAGGGDGRRRPSRARRGGQRGAARRRRPGRADPADPRDRPAERRAARVDARPRGGGQRPHPGGGRGASACAGAGTEYFSLMVPETALRPGRNRVELFEVRPGGRLTELARTSRARAGSAWRSGRGRSRVGCLSRRGRSRSSGRGRRAGCSCGSSRRRGARRVGRLDVAVQLLRRRAPGRRHAGPGRPRSRWLGLGDDRRTRGQAGGEHAEHARHEQARADAVGEHLELRLGRRARVGRRAALPHAAGEPRADRADEDQVAEGREQDGRDQVDPGRAPGAACAAGRRRAA